MEARFNLAFKYVRALSTRTWWPTNLGSWAFSGYLHNCGNRERVWRWLSSLFLVWGLRGNLWIFAGEAAWVFYKRGHLDRRVFSAWNRNFLINVVLIAFISFFPGVSWGAHLGGAIAGLLIALWLNYFQFQPGWRRWLQWVGVLVIPLLSVGLLVRERCKQVANGRRFAKTRKGRK